MPLAFDEGIGRRKVGMIPPITNSAMNVGSPEWCDSSAYRLLCEVGPNYCQDGEIGDKCAYNMASGCTPS
jgi:hypothetical protein